MLEPGVSHWLADPEAAPALRDVTVADLLDEAAAKWSDVDAVVYSAYDEPELRIRWTFGELQERVRDVSAALIGSGLGPGSKVVVWSTSLPQLPLLQFACAYANVTMLPINPLYRRNELSYVLSKTEPDAIFLVDQHRDVSLLAILDEVAADIPSLRLRVTFGEASDTSAIAWSDWLTGAGAATSLDQVLERRAALRPSDLAQIQFTSGTTGFPKGVELTQWTLANQGIQMASRGMFRPGDRLVNPMPLFHNGGCVLAVLGAAANGTTHYPIVSFDPAPICRTVEAERATILFGVPTMLLAVQEEASRRQTDLTSIRTVVTGGSSVPAELCREWRERLGVNFVITYGQTEHGPLATTTSPLDPPERQVTTIGRPIPHAELDIVEPGTENRVPVGQEGEIRYRGYVMRGYYRDPEATARAVSPDGWLRSGDLGRIDEEGYVQITGRAKDMIIRGGENIAPASVEDAVRHLEQVADVCVIGVPDEKMGEEICAFVRLHEGTALDAVQLRELLLTEIARYRIPRYLAVMDRFPVTPSGKIQRYKLREMFQEGLETGTVQDSRRSIKVT